MQSWESPLLVLIPLVAGLLTLVMPKAAAKAASLIGSVATLAVFGYMLNRFQANAAFQFNYETMWLEDFRIGFGLGMDGLNLVPLLLTTLLCPLIIVSVDPEKYRNQSAFFGLILLMEAGLSLVFLAKTGFTFYLGWEAALIPILFISGIWGSENRVRATMKFFIYTVAGSLFLLFGLVCLYQLTNGEEVRDSLESFYRLQIDPQVQIWLFWFIFIAFAIKMPIFPFHTWQPDVYVHAPTPGTMLLSGIMLKMGIYGTLRWLLPIFPAGVEYWQDTIIILSVIGVVYGAIIAIKQMDIKRLLAYSSFSHVGLICAGIFTLTQQGIEGAIIQMLSHGITVVGLFLAVEVVFRSTGERELDVLGGLTQTSRTLTIFFMVMLLGSVALPLTSGFIGEFLLLQSLAAHEIYLSLIAGTTVIFSAVYLLRMFQGAMFGSRPVNLAAVQPLSVGEVATFVALAVMIFWIGIFPSSFMDLISPSVQSLIQEAGN